MRRKIITGLAFFLIALIPAAPASVKAIQTATIKYGTNNNNRPIAGDWDGL